jgi:hypothetical protein
MCSVAHMAIEPGGDPHAKALYCLQMMSLARRIADQLGNDDHRRIVGRFALVFLDSYLEIARRLKNLLKAPKTTKQLNTDLNKLADDYHDYFDKIRDKLAAHRQDLPIDEAWEVWNQIDAATVGILTDNAIATWLNLTAIDASAPAYAPFGVESDPQLVAASGTPPLPGLKFSVDTLSMTRGEAGIIPTHPVQVRGGEVVSVVHTLNAEIETVGRLKSDLATQRLAKTMVVIDLCNLYDLVYGKAAGNDPEQDSFLEILETGGTAKHFDGAPLLRATVANLDHPALAVLRRLRNKICAHVDWKEPLTQLLADLDAIDDAFLEPLYRFAFDAYVEACKADPFTRVLLMKDVRLEGLESAESLAERPFN